MALNNLQWFIYHKTKLNQTKFLLISESSIAKLLKCCTADSKYGSSISSISIMFTFRVIPLGKVLNPLIHQLWVKQYHCCPYTKIAWVLNKLQRLIKQRKQKKHYWEKRVVFSLSLRKQNGHFMLTHENFV